MTCSAGRGRRRLSRSRAPPPEPISFCPSPSGPLILLRRLLLLPLLAPLLAVLLLAALNPGPAVRLRLLTVRTTSLPLGLWLAAAAGGGALVSGTAAALALWQGRRSLAAERGERSRESEQGEPWSMGGWPGGRAGAQQSEAVDVSAGERGGERWSPIGPERGPGEPPPTLSVPFRVIRRPTRSSAAASRAATAPDPGPSAAVAVAEVQVAQGSAADDWNRSSEQEDW